MRRKSSPWAHVRNRIVRGLLVVLPLLITVWLLRVLFDLVNGNITPIVAVVFRALGIEGLDRWQHRIGFPVVGVLLTVLLVYLIGLVTGQVAGRRVLAMFESWILRIPLVKGIYGAARQLLDAFGATGKRSFSKVVMLEYPRAGLWTVGFVTSESRHAVVRGPDDAPVEMISVFLPTTPNPTSGWLVYVPKNDLRVLDLPIEAGIKLVVSGGIVSPDDLGRLVVPWTDAETGV